MYGVDEVEHCDLIEIPRRDLLPEYLTLNFPEYLLSGSFVGNILYTYKLYVK